MVIDSGFTGRDSSKLRGWSYRTQTCLSTDAPKQMVRNANRQNQHWCVYDASVGVMLHRDFIRTLLRTFCWWCSLSWSYAGSVCSGYKSVNGVCILSKIIHHAGIWSLWCSWTEPALFLNEIRISPGQQCQALWWTFRQAAERSLCVCVCVWAQNHDHTASKR